MKMNDTSPVLTEACSPVFEKELPASSNVELESWYQPMTSSRERRGALGNPIVILLSAASVKKEAKYPGYIECGTTVWRKL